MKRREPKEKLQYLYSLGILILVSIGALLSLMNAKYLLVEYEPKPTYITTKNGYIYKVRPVTEQIKPLESIKADISEFLHDYYDYNYVNYQKHVMNLEGYFEKKIYQETVIPFFNDSHDINTLKELYGVITPIKIDPIELVADGNINGRLAWKFTTSVRLITYYGDGRKLPETKKVEIIYARANLDEDEDEHFIVHFLEVSE